MPGLLLGVGLTLTATGVTVLQAADSPFWQIFGWSLTVSGLIVLLLAGVSFYRVSRVSARRRAFKDLLGSADARAIHLYPRGPDRYDLHSQLKLGDFRTLSTDTAQAIEAALGPGEATRFRFIARKVHDKPPFVIQGSSSAGEFLAPEDARLALDEYRGAVADLVGRVDSLAIDSDFDASAWRGRFTDS